MLKYETKMLCLGYIETTLKDHRKTADRGCMCKGGMKTARSFLQYRKVLPRAEGTHETKNCNERFQGRTEDYLTNWIWGDRKEE